MGKSRLTLTTRNSLLQAKFCMTNGNGSSTPPCDLKPPHTDRMALRPVFESVANRDARQKHGLLGDKDSATAAPRKAA